MTRFFLVLALLLTPIAAVAQTSYNTVLNHRATSDLTVDQLCDKARVGTQPCVPFMAIDGQVPQARAIDAKSAERVSVMDYCKPSQVGDGNDATQCTQNAVDAVCAAKGGTLYWPAGAYRYDGTLNLSCSGLTLEGAGVGNPYDSKGTHIIAGHRTDGNAVFKAQVGGFTNTVGEKDAPSTQGGTQRFSFGPVIRNMGFENKGGSVANGRPGAFVELNYTTYSLLDHVTMYAACTGLKVYGGFFVGVKNSQVEGFNGNCNVVDLHGDKAKSFTTLDAVYFDKVEVTNFGGNGSCYNITDRVQTVWWTNTTCQTGGNALRSTCPSMASFSDCPGFFTLNDFEAESNSTSYSVIDITELADGFVMTGSWLRGFYSGNAANNLISITPGRFPAARQGLPVTIADSWFKHAGGSCLYIQNERAVIRGNHIYGCGRRADGPAYGAIEIRANYATVNANTLGGADYLNDASSFATGVLVSNNANYVAVTGNIIAGGVSSAVTNAGTGTAVNSTGNVGL